MDFYLVRNKHIFSKNHFILEKKRFIFKFCEYVLINELYKNNTFNGKKSFGINALLLPYYKKTFWGLKQIQMDFQILKFMPLFGPPHYAFTLICI